MSERIVKVSTSAFFRIPATSEVLVDRVVLAGDRHIVPVVGFMDVLTGEAIVNELAMETEFGMQLVDYVHNGDTIDEVPF